MLQWPHVLCARRDCAIWENGGRLLLTFVYAFISYTVLCSFYDTSDLCTVEIEANYAVLVACNSGNKDILIYMDGFKPAFFLMANRA